MIRREGHGAGFAELRRCGDSNDRHRRPGGLRQVQARSLNGRLNPLKGVGSADGGGGKGARGNPFDPAEPLIYAFAVGFVFLLTPCGFALLPAYAAYRLGDKASTPKVLLGGLASTLGLLTVFALLGALASTLGSFLMGVVPWLHALIAVLLTVLGLTMLIGVHPPVP